MSSCGRGRRISVRTKLTMALADTLAPILAKFGGRAFAVIDGARFPDIRSNRGWLRLSSEQMERIKETMQARSHGRIARYLRETAGSCLVSMGRTQLQDFVVAAESRGRAIGLRTERGLGQFAFLELVSQGTFAASDRARQFLRSGPGTPDQSMNELLVAMTDTCRRMQHQ